MPLEDARRDLVDLRAVGDVAELPLAADLAAIRSSCSARRARRTQCQPARASSRAVASPIPDEAPVTTATRPPAIAAASLSV